MAERTVRGWDALSAAQLVALMDERWVVEMVALWADCSAAVRVDW